MNISHKRIKNFPESDGHIKSILIGLRVAKVSFQTRDSPKLVLIYNDVESVEEQNFVFGDIAQYTETKMENGFIKYSFEDSYGYVVLNIFTQSIRIFKVGNNADINCALFDVEFDYIGNQNFHDYSE